MHEEIATSVMCMMLPYTCAVIILILMVIWISKGKNRDFFDIRTSNHSKGKLLSRNAFYVCKDCGVEFRIPSGRSPDICPSCGTKLVEIPAGIDEDAAPYVCPHCGPYYLLDGGDSSSCPICGREDVESAAWFAKRPFHWECSECGQEFMVSSIPTQCPYCEAEFKGTAEEADNESSLGKCPSCGESVEMFDGESMEFCPKCGRELG